MAEKRILMIEDDEEMIALGELILEKEGFIVRSATTGPAGLEILRQDLADLILLDIMMDGMNGWEVLDEIKKDERLAHIPVIMLTAIHYLEDQDAMAAHGGQFASYIVKPFVVRELIHEVKKALA